MADIAGLKRLIGSWRGVNSLWLEPGTPASESETSATVSDAVRGKFVTLHYAWAHAGEPHEGLLLIGANDSGVQMSWVDSFHTADGVMHLLGTGEGEVCAATCEYRVGDSEPWGWRIELEPRGGDAFQMRMFNILPASMGGAEMLAVQADYTRS